MGSSPTGPPPGYEEIAAPPAGYEEVSAPAELPPSGNVIRPAETGPKAFLENLMSDIQSGTTITPVGRALRFAGAQGTRSGVSGETGAIVGGPAEGIPRALHGFLLTQQARVGQPSEFARGANEMFQGVGQVAAPIAGATNPAFLPMAAGFGIAQQGGQATAGALGASPETSQFLGNLAGVAALGAPKLPEMFGAKGTPAERLSFALSKTLPKAQWAKINERLAAVGEKVPEVVGGAKTVADAASKMKQRSLDLGQQFSDAIQPVKGNDISPQVAKLRVSLEQAAQNADPYNANAYRSMAEKVSDLKTLGQLDDFVAGFNKTSRFNAAPESVVRQALTETVRSITGQDFSPLRLEQSHWYTLARAAQKAAIPEQLASLQSKVASPSRKLAQFALEVPKTTTGALLSGAKLLQPSAQSLIRSIPEAPASAAGQLARSVTVPPDMPPASPFDVARMANKAAAMDPALKALDTELRQRAAAFQQQRETLGPLGLESQQTFNPSPNPADIPPAQPYYQRYGQMQEPAAETNPWAGTSAGTQPYQPTSTDPRWANTEVGQGPSTPSGNPVVQQAMKEALTKAGGELRPGVASQAQTIAEESGRAGKIKSFLDNTLLKEKQTQIGQSVLDDMEMRGESPIELNKRFWSETFPKLDPEVQGRFTRYLQKETSFKPGDTIGFTADKQPIIARNWQHIAETILDLSHNPAELEGTTRGLVSLMKIAEMLQGKGGSAPSMQPGVKPLL